MKEEKWNCLPNVQQIPSLKESTTAGKTKNRETYRNFTIGPSQSPFSILFKPFLLSLESNHKHKSIFEHFTQKKLYLFFLWSRLLLSSRTSKLETKKTLRESGEIPCLVCRRKRVNICLKIPDKSGLSIVASHRDNVKLDLPSTKNI